MALKARQDADVSSYNQNTQQWMVLPVTSKPRGGRLTATDCENYSGPWRLGEFALELGKKRNNTYAMGGVPVTIAMILSFANFNGLRHLFIPGARYLQHHTVQLRKNFWHRARKWWFLDRMQSLLGTTVNKSR